MLTSLLRRNVFTNFSTGSRNIKTITVIGAGLMGAGITQISAQNGYSVRLVDRQDNLLQKSLGSLENSLKRVAKKKFSDDLPASKKFVSDILSNVTVSTDPKSAVVGSDLVIEAIVENLQVKRDLFK
ncbi:unnamed protein product [Protopolystoma xenopodis]|uniref:3-hydroxyacyl-CoA dehydrogenase NAD binding domain-containing protein n=1 Tax=Protopolystoma xenopodis TaxID=117903 RepID=A0A448WHE8_9PLAT|nr:unnamed protein product [Protopolystoma xenopodis]